MYIQHNDLRVARKRSHLTQTDYAFILNLTDYNTVSKWELGHHRPVLESLLSYNIIFELPIESFFAEQRKQIIDTLCTRIPLRIQQLKEQKTDQQQSLRIAFLESLLSRLSSLAAV